MKILPNVKELFIKNNISGSKYHLIKDKTILGYRMYFILGNGKETQGWEFLSDELLKGDNEITIITAKEYYEDTAINLYRS